MRQYITFFCSLFALSSVVFAQDSLFPELKFSEEESTIPATIENKEEIKDDNAPVAIEQEGISEEANVTVQKVDNAKNSQEKIDEENEESEEEEEEEKVYIALNNIKATITAVKAVSYCSADFVVYNGFKKRPVNDLSVSLKIGTIDKVFNFKGVKPEETAGENFMMVGEACEYIYKTPSIDIQKCQIQGISEKKCKEKIEFIPVPQDNSEMGN